MIQKKCGDCVHIYACALWNKGAEFAADATNCDIFETEKMTSAYLLGRIDGRQEGKNAEEIKNCKVCLSYEVCRPLMDNKAEGCFFYKSKAKWCEIADS